MERAHCDSPYQRGRRTPNMFHAALILEEDWAKNMGTMRTTFDV
jgi:hypothetical protein